MKISARIALVVAAALVVIAVRQAFAAPITASGRPISPAIGFAPRYNTHLLVWAEDRGTGTGLDLYAAQVTSTGIVVGREVPLVVASGDQSDPALAFNERLGDYLVVYTQTGGPGVTPTPGVPIPGTPGSGGTPPAFPTPPGPPLARLSVSEFHAEAFAGALDALPALEPLDIGPYQPPVPTTLPSATLPPGTQPPLPTPIGTDPATSLPPPPGTATNVPPTAGPQPTATSGTAPVPPPPSTAPGSRDIYGIWASANGFATTGTFPIVASPADDTFPALAYHPQPSFDQWVLVWRDVTGSDVSLKTVELAGYGRYMTYGSGVNTIISGGDHSRPAVAAGAEGDFVVAWSQSETGRIDRDVVGRRLNANGFPIGPILRLVDSDADETYPSLGALLDTGDYLLAWESRVPGEDPDIRVRRLNRNGIPLRAAYDVAGGGPFSFSPSLPTTDESTLLMAWLDRNPASDHSIMGAQLTRDGRRLGPERVLVQGGAGPAGVTPIPPPPGFPTVPPIPPPPTP